MDCRKEKSKDEEIFNGKHGQKGLNVGKTSGKLKFAGFSSALISFLLQFQCKESTVTPSTQHNLRFFIPTRLTISEHNFLHE